LHQLNVFSPSHIERVLVRAEQGTETMCNIATPKTGLEAKFSLRFMAAAALLGKDTASLALYADESVRDPALCGLRDKVVIEFVKDWPKMQSEVIVELNDGRKLGATHDAGIPPKDYVEQGQRLRAKFERLAQPTVGAVQAIRIARLVDDLESKTVPELMTACAGASRTTRLDT
jgi:2-methylcitrate dehydratase PrpD